MIEQPLPIDFAYATSVGVWSKPGCKGNGFVEKRENCNLRDLQRNKIPAILLKDRKRGSARAWSKSLEWESQVHTHRHHQIYL